MTESSKSSLLEIWDTARIPAICDWPSDRHSQFILQPELFSHLLKWNSFQHLSPAVFLWRQVGASPYIHRCSNITWERSILSMLLLEAWSFNVIGLWSAWVDPQNKIIEWESTLKTPSLQSCQWFWVLRSCPNNTFKGERKGEIIFWLEKWLVRSNTALFVNMQSAYFTVHQSDHGGQKFFLSNFSL